jgi:hypothetical protein
MSVTKESTRSPPSSAIGTLRSKMFPSQASTSRDAGNSRGSCSCSRVRTFEATSPIIQPGVLQTAHQPAPPTPLYSMERATEFTACSAMRSTPTNRTPDPDIHSFKNCSAPASVRKEDLHENRRIWEFHRSAAMYATPSY